MAVQNLTATRLASNTVVYLVVWTALANGDTFTVNGKSITFDTATVTATKSSTDASGNVTFYTQSAAAVSDLLSAIDTAAGNTGTGSVASTVAAGKLQADGVIRYRRGHIAVVERFGLETRACECYAVVKKELGRLLSDVRHRQAQPAL